MLHLESKLYKGKTVSSLSIGLLGLHLTLGSYVIANPTGGNVTHGAASISSAGSTLNVNQLTDKAIINWDSFSIAQGETTQFNQLSATSAVLNRVVGGDISKIYGNLKANGQVFLINGNGIVIGESGVIDTAGFLATTHSIKDADFLNGGDLVLEPGKNLKGASIINLGKISASGGDIFLIADHVTNEGIIDASNGTAGLAAAGGSRVLLAESGDQRILIQPSTAAKTDKDGVINKGTIKAVNAEIKAAGGNIYALAINNNGVVRATGVQKKGGRILLTSKNGNIKLGKNSRLNASGKKGGGKINVGGNKQGKGDVAIAKSVTTEKGSKLTADAIESGNGGSIIVFAEGNTSIAGDFSAQGGALNGNGGFIETSGKQNLLVANGTQVNTSAANGVSGTWLLDPTNFTISAGRAASTDSGIGADTLVSNLGTSSVLIQTVATGSEDGDITVDSGLNWNGSNSLTLMAHHDIIFNASVQHDGSGDLNLIAGWDGTTAFNATTFDTVDVNATARLYGNNDGSIFIGTGTQTSGIAVASRNGATRAYGHDLNILAGTGGNGRYAQLGFQVSDQGDGYSISGDINARVLHNITATGGAGNNLNYAQLGHIGADQIADGNVEAAVAASIRIAAGNNLSFESGGGARAYSQLGHGGTFADGDHSGTIVITSANDLSFMAGGERDAYSQLGHGGAFVDGDHSGEIRITSANDLSFMGGSAFAYSQLGHGGLGADGDNSGTIRITSANDLSFMAGGGDRAYSQLGHGGVQADGDHSGDITITSANDLSFMAGGGDRAYSQLGHGGTFADGSHSGLIDVTVAGNLTFTGQNVSNRYALLGHGDEPNAADDNRDTVSGNVQVRVAGDVSLTNGYLGHLIDADGTYDANSDTYLGVGGQLSFNAGSSLQSGRELRLYLADTTTNVTFNPNASLNGNTVSSVSNLISGNHVFGTGDYASPTDVTANGNFAFYNLQAVGYDYEVEASHASNIATALNTGEVTLDTTQGQTDFGARANYFSTVNNITVNSGLAYDSTNNLNLLATGDITFNASVQNSSATAGGDLNLIAGWDGTTAFNATTFDTVDVNAGASLYGNNDGSIFIGTGTQTSGIAVASRNGTTRAYGHDLNILAGTGGNGRYAQLGFQVSDQGDGYSISGDINARVLNNITATGGAGNDYNYAQLGHIGADLRPDGNIEAAVEASIRIAAGNNLSFESSGGRNAYSQLGHGGFFAAGSHSGTIMITSANDLRFSGGDRSAYSQLGHGGANAAGDHSGDIRITSANDLSFMASGSEAYSQLGHGGIAAVGDHRGDITITSANDLSFMGGGFSAYSQLGHGGTFADGDHSGTVVITSANDLSFMGGSGRRAYSQLGHGGADASGTREGNITVASTGEWSLVNGTGDNWVIGHITTSGAVVSNANIQLSAGSIDYSTATTSADATINSDFAAQVGRLLAGGDVTLNILGTDGSNGNLLYQGATNYASTNDLTLMSTKDISFNASVQNSSATAGGELNLIAGWDGTTAFNATTFDAVDVNATASLYGNNDGSIFIGTGAQTSGIAVASRNGTTRAYGHDLNILAGTGDDGRYAQLGFQVSDQGDGYSISGDINARVLNNINAKGGAGNNRNYAQLGHIGADQTSDVNVDAAVAASIRIAAGSNLSFESGLGRRAYSQLGHGGANAAGDHSGDIRITSANDLSFMAGGGDAYSQLGHGGENADGDHSGDIRITSANDLSFMGGSGRRAYSQLGHGGVFADGNHSGDITITSANDLSFMAGGGNSAYSQLGHGGTFADGDHSGEIRITSASDLSFMGGSGLRAYSQLGHGGVFADGDHSGEIRITSANDLSFMAGGGVDAYSQLGHEGAFADGDHSGTVVITSANDLSFMGGSGLRAYSQLGHGGAFADGDHSGTIMVTSANDLSFMAGGGDSAYSQLGHGGADADGNHSGLIDVTVAGNLTFTGQNASDQYALIGHGDEPGDSDNGDTVSGNVLVRVAGDVSLTNAYLGHLIDADGTYEANSDTYLGIGGQLSFNVGSSLQSGRELRLYLAGTTSSVVFNADASLNGNTVSSVANVVGDHTFGTGSYATAAEITANGNFAFYNTGTTGSTTGSSVGGVRETQSENFWSWVSREGEFLGGASPELIEFHYFKGNLQELRHLLNLEQQSKKGTREMTEEERGKLRELLSSQSSVASFQ